MNYKGGVTGGSKSIYLHNKQKLSSHDTYPSGVQGK